MFIEHIAIAVNDPEAAAAWYCEHFAMKIVNRGGGGDVFVADDRGNVVLQFEDANRIFDTPEKGTLNYRDRDMRQLHLAFWADDVATERSRLLEAGATADDEVTITATGDEMATIRDPWGLPVQVVKRAKPLV